MASNSQTDNLRWWLSKKGTPVGPYDAAFINDGLTNGKIPPDTYACLVGGKTWKKLCESNTFAAACTAAPARPANAAAVTTPSPAAQASPAVLCPAQLDADEYRVAGERGAKALGLVALILVMLVLVVGGLWFLPPILIVIAVIGTWIIQGRYLGNSVKVSPTQFPDIDDVAERVAARLGMQRPEVFLTFSPVINASAIGFLGRRSVLLHSALVEAMDQDELRYIVGHEFSHIKCGHTRIAALLTSQYGWGRVILISDVLDFLFLWWSRKAEYTCDRGGLIACRNQRAAILAMCKMAVGPKLFAKLDLSSFLGQQQDLDQDQIAKLSETLGTHPYVLKRIRAIQAFAASAEYAALVARSS